MKKFCLTPLAALLALLLLGCAANPAQTEASAAAPSTEATCAPTEAPTQAPFDLSEAAVSGAEGFYELSALDELAGLEIAEAALMDENTLLLLTGPQQDTLHTFNLRTGALEQLCTLDWAEEIPESADSPEDEGYWTSRSFLSADPIVLFGYGDTEQCFLVAADGTVTELPVSYGDGSVNYFGCIYAADSLYWYCSGRYGLQRMDYATLEAAQVGTVPTDYLYSYIVGQTAGGEAVLSADACNGEAVTMLMDLQSGEITAVYEGYCAESLMTRWSTDVISDGETYTSYTLTAYAGAQQASGEFSIALLSHAQSAAAGWLSGALQGQSPGRSLLYVDWDDGERTLILWDYGTDALADCPSAGLTAFQNGDYQAPTERIAQMQAQYGVTIYVGEAVLRAPIPDYTLSVWEDAEAIDAALDALEDAFSRYPEGYLAQLGGSDTRAICFYLSGEMTPIDPGQNILNPSGLACRVGDLELIALNVGGCVRAQDVIHELTHILDHSLTGILDEDMWNSMNPEGFTYPYAYIDDNGVSYEWGDTTYTADDYAYYYEGNVESVYFVDAYATTFPTEDRARLMEYLLRDADAEPELYFASSHIQQKLTYYFRCIREVFDTTGWPEQALWEAKLSQALAAESAAG